MNNKPNQAPTSRESEMREQCLIWGFPSVAILIISLFVSLSIGEQFKQQTFATVVSFFACNLLLFLIYYTIFISLSLSHAQYKRKGKEDVKGDVVADVEVVETAQEQAIIDEEKADEPAQTFSTQQTPQPPIIPFFTQVNYDTQRQAFLKEQEEKREAIIACIIDYTQTMMSQIMRPTEVENLCKEVIAWAADAEYTPNPVRTLPEANKLDAKHYVWNIAARLGGEHAKVNNRSRFIQHLFAEMFRDNDFSSMKNLKIKPEEGTIKIDEPTKGSYKFTTIKKVEVA